MALGTVFWSICNSKPARSLGLQIGRTIANELIKGASSELPGRVRLPIAGLRNSPARSRAIEMTLLQVPGVREVRANALTGNVLVLFDHQVIDVPTIQHLIEHEAMGLLPFPTGELGTPGKVAHPAIAEVSVRTH